MKKNKNLPFVMYATAWCGDCRKVKNWLEKNDFEEGKDYTEINIEEQEEAADIVIQANKGKKSVPTLIFPDGSSLTEPTDSELEEKLL